MFRLVARIGVHLRQSCTMGAATILFINVTVTIEAMLNFDGDGVCKQDLTGPTHELLATK